MEVNTDNQGKDFSSLKRSRSAHASHLTRIYKELEEQMMSYDNADQVEQLHKKLCNTFDKFKTAHLECLDNCLDSDVCETLEMHYGSCKKNLEEFQVRFSQWKNAEEKTPDEESGSVIGSVSASSSASSKRSLRNAKAKRLIAEHKHKMLEEKLNLEREEREINIKKQLLESKTLIDEAKFEESVWEEAVQEDEEVYITNRERATQAVQIVSKENELHAITSPTQCTRNYGNQNKIQTSNAVQCETSSTSVASMDQAFQRLATTLQEGFNLPKPDLLRFSGSSLEYCKFICNFESNIEKTVHDDRLKLCYLIQYCDGEAKRAIEDCVLLDSSEGYKRAREILYSRYGRPHTITRMYVDKLVQGPVLKASDTDGLSNLALEMQKCEITLTQLGFRSDIDSTENLRKLVKRLPYHVRSKWVDKAHSITESGREPCFSDLVRFVDERARVATSMYGLDLAQESGHKNSVDKTSKTAKPSNQTSSKPNVTTLATNSVNDKYVYTKKCYCCSGKCEDLASCRQFSGMSLSDREQFVRKTKLCFNCLKGKHFSKDCKKPVGCTVPDCKTKHHVLLHSWVNRVSDHIATGSSVNCTSLQGSVVKNCLGIIPITVQGSNGASVQTYAILDDGANKTLCDESLLSTLNLPTKPITFEMSTVSSAARAIEGRQLDIDVRPVHGNATVRLRNVWTVKQLPISTRTKPRNSDFRKLPYLSDVDIPEIDGDAVTLLIGTDCPDAHIPLEVRSGNGDEPYAIRTKLGWTVRGPIPTNMITNSVSVNFGQSFDVMLQQQLEKMWNTDFDDKLRIEKNVMSLEDKRALKMMESSTRYENGHYKLKLPWRNENAKIPNNLPLAHARLEQLKRKLSRDHTLHAMYTATVTDYIEKGYAAEVSNIESSSSRVWYLPHHPVVNPNKPGKVRVVFDCAAKYRGTSLNSQLLQGPDFMNNLVGVVIRFRQEHIALAADIEAMFHQVRVSDEDCDSLRFLWWPGGDLTKQPKCYRMEVHLFGATSSPSCTAYALRRTAKDHADSFPKDVISTVKRNFYVDDCLKSLPSVDQAIQLASDIQELMKKGGFRLTKWLSNSKRVVESIPESERAPSVVNNLDKGDSSPLERALGVHWDVTKDEIKFKVSLSNRPLTRRGILSVVSSIFDPLGLVSPVTLRAKAIVQSLCRQKLRWDDPIPEVAVQEWQHWLKKLPALENLKVRRCFKPDYFGHVINVQLHLFCDGSELGYGACAYLRLTDENGKVACSLVIGKSRLAPIKQTSIPRLELSAAVVASRLYGFISDELEITIDKVTFWTDSMIVLGYLRNETRRFKTFVGNRVSQIHDVTSPDQWRHVSSELNPADIASRSIDASDVDSLNTWLNGPKFLMKSEQHWPKQALPPEVNDEDPEVKKTVITITECDCNNAFETLICYYSDWTKLKRAVAWFTRFKQYCQRKYLKNDTQYSTCDLSVTELESACGDILKYVQERCFKNEMKILKTEGVVKKQSKIASLNPRIKNDLLRVDGRVRQQHELPIILPSKHHVTTLIIRSYHESLGHAGSQTVLGSIREQYWIIKGLASVKREVRSCVTCRRQRGLPLSQQMSPLLEEQMAADVTPFTYVGIDYFGPLFVKLGRSRAKRYGCLFTCLNTRAVHIEISHSLSTDSFISAFQRFTSRRGLPQKVFSDNGTNLVAGEVEIRKAIEKWNQSKIGRHMTQRTIEWHFNPPCASHKGGSWERLIRSTRTILKSLVKEQLLNDEQLLTFMAETEKILNDRPLTTVSNDPKDHMPLTPNTLLLMKSNQSLPIDVFDKRDVYAKRWWRQAQYLADVFWRRWLREYLPVLQKRQIWQRKTTDLKLDDIVLVVTENTPRGQWPLARVVEVKHGRDGLVRSCVVRTQRSQLVRPVTKLCLLESSK